MNHFQEIKPEQLTGNPFSLIGSDWMLLTAQKEDQINTMTAAWGGLGIMWNKPVAFVVIRPQRYTLEFVDAATCFSLTFFPDHYRNALNYLGTVSGRDENKIDRSGLTLRADEAAPYFEQARLVLFCRKLYRQDMGAEHFLQDSLQDFYAKKDYHILFVAEIEKILQKQDE